MSDDLMFEIESILQSKPFKDCRWELSNVPADSILNAMGDDRIWALNVQVKGRLDPFLRCVGPPHMILKYLKIKITDSSDATS